MKCKLIYVLIINTLLSISVICCWPYPPPPPPPPHTLHLFEDHYMRYQGPHSPYERGLAHMASHPSSQAMPSIGSSNHMNHHLFYPMPSINPIPAMSYAEPQERLYPGTTDFDFGNSGQQFVGYPRPREPQLMKVRHMNYRYRKRMKSQRPIEENGFSQKDSHGFGSQPRRYNVIDSRGEFQKKIPNSVNDKLAPPKAASPKKLFDEEESSPHNSSFNQLMDKTDRKSDAKQRDLQENGAQTKDIHNSIKHQADMPIEVTSYSMKSPDGAVTQVTEMLYDVENNPFKPSTSIPIVSPVWKPSTQNWSPSIRTVTENPFVTQSPYLTSAFSEMDTGSTLNGQPFNTAVTAQFNDITMSPIVSFTSQRSPSNTMDPLPTMFTNEPSLPPTPPRLRTSASPSDYYSRRARKKLSTQKPSSTTSRNAARESKPGLSGAAIAGIVIGSMVSIMLLAGTSLFVMYRNPFRRTLSPQRSADPLPNVRSNDNTVPQVHRWQPRRQRRL